MTIKDYFSKTFETSDNQAIQSLKTHYYHCRVEEVKEKVLKVLKMKKAIIKNVDDERGEIIVDSTAFSGSVTIIATSFTEIAVDMQVMTYNFLPTAKGKKIIEDIYELLDKELPLKGVGLHSR